MPASNALELVVASALITVVGMFIAYIRYKDKLLSEAHKQFTANLHNIIHSNNNMIRRFDKLIENVVMLEQRIAQFLNQHHPPGK